MTRVRNSKFVIPLTGLIRLCISWVRALLDQNVILVLQVGIYYTALSLSVRNNVNHILSFCLCYNLSDVTPAIVSFAPLNGTCGANFVLSCSASTGTVASQDAAIAIIRQSDGTDLATDSRFIRTRTNVAANTVRLDFNFSSVFDDNGVYTCIVNTSVGSIARNTSVMICKTPMFFLPPFSCTIRQPKKCRHAVGTAKHFLFCKGISMRSMDESV